MSNISEEQRLNLGKSPLDLRDKAARLNGLIRFGEGTAGIVAERDALIAEHVRLYGYAPRISLAPFCPAA